MRLADALLLIAPAARRSARGRGICPSASRCPWAGRRCHIARSARQILWLRRRCRHWHKLPARAMWPSPPGERASMSFTTARKFSGSSALVHLTPNARGGLVGQRLDPDLVLQRLCGGKSSGPSTTMRPSIHTSLVEERNTLTPAGAVPAHCGPTIQNVPPWPLVRRVPMPGEVVGEGVHEGDVEIALACRWARSTSIGPPESSSCAEE